MDGAAAPIEAPPAIAAAAGGKIEIVLESGVRRGVHMLKSLSLGAHACAVGRPYLYGLAAGGEAGVTRALQILRSELIRAMQLGGCASLSDISERLLLQKIET